MALSAARLGVDDGGRGSHLPHVTGMVTDLDAHLTQRAPTSLSAELTRREKILAAGAKDVEDYTERAGVPAPPPTPAPAGDRATVATRTREWFTEYLPARVRCGNEFQDASRRQVLLVDPHAEG